MQLSFKNWILCFQQYQKITEKYLNDQNWISKSVLAEAKDAVNTICNRDRAFF